MTDLAEMIAWAERRLAFCESREAFRHNATRYRDLVAMLRGIETARAAGAADQRDAARWRAFVSSQRFKLIGSANFDWTDRMAPRPKPGPLHFGLEVWDVHEAGSDAQGQQGRALLHAYVDEMVARTAPSSDRYLIWSNTHGAWWRPKSAGYTSDLATAGRYTREEAIDICARCRDGYTFRPTPTEIPIREDEAARRGSRHMSELVRPEDDAECRARDLERKPAARDAR